MQDRNIVDWEDMGFAGVTDDGEEPMEWSAVGLSDWGWMKGPNGRVSTVASHGIIPGEMLGGLAVEVDEDDEWAPGVVRTPMLELALDDYVYMNQNGKPYDGMLGLSDTGEVYAYDGSLGFFKKLFKRVKKRVKKVARRVKKGIKKVLKKSRFGRALLKIGGKIRKIAMKIVRPLMKFVGKFAAKLAPIAAMIPGYGTAVAGALMAAGKVANVMKKWGVSTKGKPGKVRGLKFKNPKAIKAFRKDLANQAAKMARLKKRNPRRFKELATSLARKR